MSTDPVLPIPSEAANTPLPRRRWTSTDRKHLIVWLVLSFILPAVPLFFLYPDATRGRVVWTAESEIFSKSIAAFGVALGTWVVSHLQKRRMDDYGIPPRQALGSRFWEGAVWGFAMLSAVLFTLRAAGYLQIQSVALSGAAIYKYAFGWGLAFYLVGVSEEFAFRGYALFLAASRIGFWRAALSLSVGFAMAHIPNPGETFFGVLQVLVIGLVFCFMVRRTGTLWFALGFHAAWDWAQTFFFGTPDSGLVGHGHFLNSSEQGPSWLAGGSAGPEGSIFAVLVLLICAGFIHLRFPNAVYPDRPV